MWIIKWRNCSRSLTVTTGLSRYPSVEAAGRQIAIWRRFFPFNSYYVERVL